MLDVLFLLIAGHALADYPLQGEFLAKGKNHKLPIEGVPFYHCLLSHALIHSGVVFLITGSLVIGLLEFLAHALIDFGKCQGWYGLNVDQALHIACKIIWVLIIFA